MASTTSLMNHHANIEKKISEEMKRPMPDDTLLRQLKREKLTIKEQIVAKA